jgi:hypothetical protein
MANPSHPFPNLHIQLLSGLSFPWAEVQEPGGGTFSMHAGPDGVGLGMSIYIFWSDLALALQQLLGFSFRDTISWQKGRAKVPRLSRSLPWQHPYANQLFVKAITEVKGIRFEGKTFSGIPLKLPPGGTLNNLGPMSAYSIAQLTLQFWRPPYYVRSDQSVIMPDLMPDPKTGKPVPGLTYQAEYLRFFDRAWVPDVQMLTREGQTFVWTQGGLGGFPGAVGQKVTHVKLKRTWYEVPEQCLFSLLQDGSPQGPPVNQLYTQTPTSNPLTFGAAGSTEPFIYEAGEAILGCVNSEIGGDNLAIVIADKEDPAKMFLNMLVGTLLLEGVEFTPKPLQMPAVLMGIPFFKGAEALSQVQYDVTFHWDLFDPPGDPNIPFWAGGHNLMPQSGNGLWAPVRAQKDENGGDTGPFTTPYQFADFTDLFRVI